MGLHGPLRVTYPIALLFFSVLTSPSVMEDFRKARGLAPVLHADDNLTWDNNFSLVFGLASIRAPHAG